MEDKLSTSSSRSGAKLWPFDRVGCYCKFVAVIPGFSRRRISCS